MREDENNLAPLGFGIHCTIRLNCWAQLSHEELSHRNIVKTLSWSCSHRENNERLLSAVGEVAMPRAQTRASRAEKNRNYVSGFADDDEDDCGEMIYNGSRSFGDSIAKDVPIRFYGARDAMVDSSKIYDLIVVGGGVVGLAILRAATLEGWKCALVEAEPDLLSHASGSNSGIACTGVDATPGTLERALIRDSISQLRIFCKQHNIPTRACGSLVCLFPWDEADNLDLVLEESHEAGDTHASRLEAYKVKQLEPNLASSCKGGVHIPGEVVLDPWLYSIALAAHARENGADIFKSFPFDPELSSFSSGTWTVVRKEKEGSRDDFPIKLQARAVANAAGLWADVVQSKGHGQSRWTAKPRRGQYRIYSSSETTRITHPIQPIPTQRTKGIFVFSTLYDQIVVGPTALDQESKTDRSVCPLTAKELDEHAKRVIPELDTEAAFISDYVGIRPGTDKRDYQIHLFPSENWIAVAGIRSTGLTASLGIGDYVVRNLRSLLLETPKTKKEIRTTPLPSLAELVHDFRDHDGYVNIHGHNYKVTHPLTKFGWKSIEDLAPHDFPRL